MMRKAAAKVNGFGKKMNTAMAKAITPHTCSVSHVPQRFERCARKVV